MDSWRILKMLFIKGYGQEQVPSYPASLLGCRTESFIELVLAKGKGFKKQWTETVNILCLKSFEDRLFHKALLPDNWSRLKSKFPASFSITHLKNID